MGSIQIPRDSVVSQVKKILLRRISGGEIAPGTRLVELQIAREMSVSQGSVREALRELEALDLVMTVPYKGTYVREVSDQELSQAYLVRAALEDLAGQLAAPHLLGNTDELRQLAHVIRDAAGKGDLEQYSQCDVRFHQLIMEAAKNRFLLRAWESLSLAIRVRFWVIQGRIDISKIEKDHWQILEAFEAGDGIRAGQILRNHALSVMNSYRIRSQSE